MAIQNEYVPLILEYIYKYLKKGNEESIMNAIAFMDDLGITNDHLKEHLMTLSMNKDVNDRFDILDT